jgi:hypothetical protein
MSSTVALPGGCFRQGFEGRNGEVTGVMKWWDQYLIGVEE